MYAIRSYYETKNKRKKPVKSKVAIAVYGIGNSDDPVITSYSIHYTKLYDLRRINRAIS